MTSAPCKFCNRRCSAVRYLTTGPNRVIQPWLPFHMATCPGGMAYDLEIVGQTHKTAINPEDLRVWLALGKRNPWIRRASDPPFSRDSFYLCRNLDEMQAALDRRFHSWCVGQAVAYSDLCFIQQVEGGDEWLTIRHGLAFESITFERITAEGRFPNYVNRLLAATREQCRTLTYCSKERTP